MEDVDFINSLLKHSFAFRLYKRKSSFEIIFDQADRFNKQNAKKYEFVLLLKPYLSDDYPELVFAYINACLSFKNKTNRSSSIPLEMLIYLSGAKSITEAISKLGADKKGEFLIFSNSLDTLDTMEREGLIECREELKNRNINAEDLPALSNIAKNKLEAT
ncbi:hypothetical protein [Candidatus Mancarchaeum acidiphilum]|nr:hypothetical protein [Candidatus Mancarchaeum acidiphilum]